MIIVSSISPNHINSDNQLEAVKSWVNYATCYSLNTLSEIEKIKSNYPDINFIETHKTVKELCGKNLVSLNAFFDFAIDMNEDLFIINSDIIIDSLPTLAQDGITVFSRYDYTKTFEDAVMFIYGFDAFYIPKQYLKRFPPFVYGLGNSWHDLSTPYRAIKNNIPLYIPQGKYIFHKVHEIQYNYTEWMKLADYFKLEYDFDKNIAAPHLATRIMQIIKAKAIIN